MERYLKEFLEELSRKWKGSLIKVDFISHKNAKEYLNKLTKQGKIERIVWGWYYVPDKFGDALDFLRKDRNFKILVAQTAASFWNGDFVHRNIYFIVVEDKSYKKALESFARKRGWNFRIEVNENARSEIIFTRENGLNIEKPAYSAMECLQNWAFIDAFSLILTNKGVRAKMRDFYWKRISGTNVRIGQVIGYGLNRKGASKIPDTIKEDIDESIEKVKEFA
jgi:hypothetical protein